MPSKDEPAVSEKWVISEQLPALERIDTSSGPPVSPRATPVDPSPGQANMPNPPIPWTTYLSISLAALGLVFGGGSFLISFGVLAPIKRPPQEVVPPSGVARAVSTSSATPTPGRSIPSLIEASVERPQTTPTLYQVAAVAPPDVDVVRNSPQPTIYKVDQTKPKFLTFEQRLAAVKIIGKLPPPGPTDKDRYLEERRMWTLVSREKAKNGYVSSTYRMPNGALATESAAVGGPGNMIVTYKNPGDQFITWRNIANTNARRDVEIAAVVVAETKRTKGQPAVAIVSADVDGMISIR